MSVNDLSRNELRVPVPRRAGRARLLPSVVGMKHLTVDRVREILPELDELRSLLDRVVSGSQPDPSRQWAGSGELGTSGARLVDVASLPRLAADAAEAERTHLQGIYDVCARALQHVAAGDDGSAASCLLDAAAAEEQRDRPVRAALYANAAYDLARRAGDSVREALALRRRARARRSAGRLTDAERDYVRSHELAQIVSDSRGAAEAAIGAGNVLEEQGRWDEAASWYRTAIDLLGRTEGPLPEQWHALLNLHVVHRSMGALAECEAPLFEAESIARALDDPSAVPFLENARGQLLMARGDFAAAQHRFGLAIDASTSARAAVIIRLNLAEAMLAAGRHLDAAEEVRRAEQDALIAGLHQKLPEVYRLLGRIAMAEGNPDSFVLFERALDLIAARKLPELERALTLQAYADAERALGSETSADDLNAQADAIYARLGIERRRSEWADAFGRPRDADPDKTNEEAP